MNLFADKYLRWGQCFYGICIVAIGIQQLFYLELRPVIAPAWSIVLPGHTLWACAVSALFTAAGSAIIARRKAKSAALILGLILLSFFAFSHIPYMLFVSPYAKYLGAWSDALKELALAGGAFVVAGTAPVDDWSRRKWIAPLEGLEKLIPTGSILFSVTIVAFGIDHFLYKDIVVKLVPAWIPWPMFWTYFAGVALIGSGLAVIIEFKASVIALLQGIMIFLWVILLHLPRALARPFAERGNEVTSAAEALGFCGISFLIALRLRNGENGQEELENER